MSTAALVPETRNLTGEDAWTTLRRTGRRRLLADAFVRMRVSDGFSHARSLAYMTSLVAVQGVIALVGLASLIGGSGFSDMVVATIRRAAPGPAGQVLTAAVAQAHANGASHRTTAILVGIVGSLVTATTAFGQIERSMNRLYGVEQDRPTIQKYGRALLLALTAGVLSALAFVCLALGRNLFRNVASGVMSTVWNGIRWPIGLLLVAGSVTLLFHACPRRCQPRLSWLAFGSGITVILWALFTAGLGLFFHLSRSFGQTYGALAGMMALLLWALLSSMSLGFGAAVTAQLEAVREGDPKPQDEEKVESSEPDAAPHDQVHDVPVGAGR